MHDFDFSVPKRFQRVFHGVAELRLRYGDGFCGIRSVLGEQVQHQTMQDAQFGHERGSVGAVVVFHVLGNQLLQTYLQSDSIHQCWLFLRACTPNSANTVARHFSSFKANEMASTR